MGKKAQIKLFAGIIISVVIIYYSAKAMGGLNPGVLLSAHINWWLALISVAIFAFANFVRALAYPLGIEKKLGVMASFRIIGIGHAMNMVLPLRAGEGLRLMFFPPSYSAIERTRLLIVPATADFISIIMLSFLAVPFAGFKDPRLLHALNWISVASLGVFVLLLIIILSNPKLRAYCSRYMKISVLNMFVWVMLSWVVMLVSLWLGLISFGFSGVKSVRMSLAVFAATNIISFVPSTPGGIGLFEYGAVLGLGGLGISMQTAKTAGILLHLIQYAGLLPLGAVLYLTRFGKNSQKYRKNALKSPSNLGTILKK